MEVIKNTSETKFKDLDIGNVFQLRTDDASLYYMKILATEKGENAVEIDWGYLVKIYDEAEVTVYHNAKLILN